MKTYKEMLNDAFAVNKVAISQVVEDELVEADFRILCSETDDDGKIKGYHTDEKHGFITSVDGIYVGIYKESFGSWVITELVTGSLIGEPKLTRKLALLHIKVLSDTISKSLDHENNIQLAERFNECYLKEIRSVT